MDPKGVTRREHVHMGHVEKLAETAVMLGMSARQMAALSDRAWQRLRERARVPHATAAECAAAVDKVLAAEEAALLLHETNGSS